MPDNTKTPIDSTFKIVTKVSFVGEQSGTEWDCLEHTSNGKDAHELIGFINLSGLGIVNVLAQDAIAAIKNGMAAGDIGPAGTGDQPAA